jgi:adenylate cyclase
VSNSGGLDSTRSDASARLGRPRNWCAPTTFLGNIDKTDAAAPEKPFPLQRDYRRRVLPLLALFVLSLVILTALAVRQTVRDIHLEFAARHVAEIAEAVERMRPEEWEALLAGTADPEQRQRVQTSLKESVVERSLSQLKVYISGGEAVFSTDPAEIGVVEENAALTAAFEEQERGLVPHLEADGRRYNEFYIPMPNGDGAVPLVFEIYEPAGYLRAILLRALIVPTLVPSALLGGLVFMLSYLIRRAQAGIDFRAARVRELSLRLESFISSSAVGALRSAPVGGDLPLKRIEVSILYSDVRNFTAYSESASPEEVVAFLNRVATLQIECISRQNGDVDKLIGDAVLARFEGPDKERRAVAAALDIQAAVQRAKLPRGVGIGVFTGPAISGAIGPEARRDYTVIGDSVNVAARLCAEARRGEIVCDTLTTERSGLPGPIGAAQHIHVKGREKPIDIRRISHCPRADREGDASALP